MGSRGQRLPKNRRRLRFRAAPSSFWWILGARMQLSSDDLPMFFTEAHVRRAERLRAAAPAFAAIERPGAHADDAARDRAAVAALAEAGLFELVVPRAEVKE